MEIKPPKLPDKSGPALFVVTLLAIAGGCWVIQNQPSYWNVPCGCALIAIFTLLLIQSLKRWQTAEDIQLKIEVERAAREARAEQRVIEDWEETRREKEEAKKEKEQAKRQAELEKEEAKRQIELEKEETKRKIELEKEREREKSEAEKRDMETRRRRGAMRNLYHWLVGE